MWEVERVRGKQGNTITNTTLCLNKKKEIIVLSYRLQIIKLERKFFLNGSYESLGESDDTEIFMFIKMKQGLKRSRNTDLKNGECSAYFRLSV